MCRLVLLIRGDEVVVAVEYALGGAPSNGVEVNESRVLWFNGEQIASLNKDVETRDNGTWESMLSFRVPTVAENGSYEVIQKLSTGDQKVTASVFFEVRG
jgi:hypothetical protein